MRISPQKVKVYRTESDITILTLKLCSQSLFLFREEESHKPSSFLESHLSPEQIANNLRDEIKRMKRRRQIIGKLIMFN